MEHYIGYFYDPWNILDFVIVTACWASDIALRVGTGSSDSSTTGALTSLRVLRVLRPLRNITAIPRLRELVSVFLGSFRGVLSVVILLCFLLAVFGIMGVQLFHGRLRNRCFASGYDGYLINDNTVWDDLPPYVQTNVSDLLTYCKSEDESSTDQCDEETDNLYTQCYSIAQNPDQFLSLFLSLPSSGRCLHRSH